MSSCFKPFTWDLTIDLLSCDLTIDLGEGLNENPLLWVFLAISNPCSTNSVYPFKPDSSRSCLGNSRLPIFLFSFPSTYFSSLLEKVAGALLLLVTFFGLLIFPLPILGPSSSIMTVDLGLPFMVLISNSSWDIWISSEPSKMSSLSYFFGDGIAFNDLRILPARDILSSGYYWSSNIISG